MDKELLKLFEVAKKAADAAAMPGVQSTGPEVCRCIDALKKLKSFPVTIQVLARTQVAKRVRQFTKHSQEKIKAMALYLLETWKKTVSEEMKGSNKKKDGGNDCLRNKVLEVLVEALSKVGKEVGQEIKDDVCACDPRRVAVLVESVMFEKMGPFNGSRKLKYRSIMFNIKDPNNPDLRRKVLLGEIKAERLINMSPEEMASDKRQSEMNQRKEKKALAEKAAEELELKLNSNKKEHCFD